ncbi:ribosomal protein S2, partial [Enteractinococcus coprophilus]
VGMPYVNHRWLGGMLTNFATVSKRVDRMKELEEIDFDDVAGSGRTKKELLLLERELTKLQSSLGGIRNMSRTPSAIWIVDTEKEHLAVDEAKKLGIPVIAILDTNADPEDVTYPIPGNDDSMRSVAVLTRVIADAIAEGLMSRNQGASGTGSPEEPMAEWERELLESGAATTTTQTSTTGNIDEVTEILRTVQEAYPGGILIEIEQEDDTFEVEIVHEGKLHELEVAKDGTIKIEDVDQDDDDIQNAQKISVPLPDGLTQALTQHPNATIESIELEDKDGVLYWEVELKDEQGNDIEFDVPAAHSDD